MIFSMLLPFLDPHLCCHLVGELIFLHQGHSFSRNHHNVSCCFRTITTTVSATIGARVNQVHVVYMQSRHRQDISMWKYYYYIGMACSCHYTTNSTIGALLLLKLTMWAALHRCCQQLEAPFTIHIGFHEYLMRLSVNLPIDVIAFLLP